MIDKAQTPISNMSLWERTLIEGRAKKAWRRAFPESDHESIKVLVDQIVVKGATQSEMGGTLEKVSRLDRFSRKQAAAMIEKRFAPEQLHLFIHSSPEDRSSLVQSWQRGLREKAKAAANRAPGVVSTATKSVLVGGGATCLVFIVAGAMMGDASLSETGLSLLGAIADPPEGIDAAGLTPISVNGVIAAGASVSLAAATALICVKASSSLVSELFKDDPGLATQNARISLEDRVIGQFFRMKEDGFQTIKGPVSRERVIQELQTVPIEYLPLLTHFKSGELGCVNLKKVV